MRAASTPAAEAATTEVARVAVARLGGRYSVELGIDLARGGAEIERWFLAATLFGSRIPASVAMRTYRALAAAGIATVPDTEGQPWSQVVRILDSGGYARYDYRMADRLRALARALRDRLQGRVASLAGVPTARELEEALDALPGWGPVTVHLFLRELRGIWPGADPEPDQRIVTAGSHLGLLTGEPGDTRRLASVAGAAGLDVRDLEAALVRLSIAHGRRFADCPGGSECVLLCASGRTATASRV